MGCIIENALNCEHLIIGAYCEKIIIFMSMVTWFYGNYRDRDTEKDQQRKNKVCVVNSQPL